MTNYHRTQYETIKDVADTVGYFPDAEIAGVEMKPQWQTVVDPRLLREWVRLAVMESAGFTMPVRVGIGYTEDVPETANYRPMLVAQNKGSEGIHSIAPRTDWTLGGDDE